MDPELQKSLADLLAYVKQGADFAVAQAPAVAQEIVRWQICDGLIRLVACIVAAVGGFLAIAKGVALIKAENEACIPLLLCGTPMLIIGTIRMFVEAQVVVQALVAPRLVIIEYLTTHLK